MRCESRPPAKPKKSRTPKCPDLVLWGSQVVDEAATRNNLPGRQVRPLVAIEMLLVPLDGPPQALL